MRIGRWPAFIFGEISKAAMAVPNCESTTIPDVLPNSSWLRIRNSLRRAWGRVRWKITAIIAFTGTSAILIACLALAALNVVVRRESANVVEKQIQMFVQASRSVAPAILDQAGACAASPMTSGGLKPLLAYTDEAFPRAQTSLTVEGATNTQVLLAGTAIRAVKHPDWVPETGFAGLVVDGGQIEIRDVLARQQSACNLTVIFSLPLGSDLAKRLSSAAGMEVTAVSPRQFRVHPRQRVLRTLRDNFIPGISPPAAVVLSVRNWETGGMEDWVAYTVRPKYSSAFEDVARLGSQEANWVWLLAALSLTVLLLDAAGVWMSIRFGREISTTVDDLSSAAHQIASGNFGWRTPGRSKDQLGDLSCNFNEMAIALEQLQKDEAARLRLDSELQIARSVQEYLYPHVAPVLREATVSGRTMAARTIGGDLYDFFDLGPERIGILCADVSGKGIPAALMMANLQAVARAHFGDKIDGPAAPPAHFVEILNQQLAGRFGDNRYATLFWAEYDASTGVLTYVNAGHPSPILTHSTGPIERLNSVGVPIGMFANAPYTATTLQMRPGSRLVIFTDGLTDAENVAREEFGDERLIECCNTIAAGMDAKGVADRVMQAVAEWSVGTEQFDDTTVVVLDVGAVRADP
jgi:serine phosphatase RsbU (regulator of sigma subunit)